MNPGDVGGLFPGSYNVIPVEPHELTVDECKAQLRNYELILDLMARLANDGVKKNEVTLRSTIIDPIGKCAFKGCKNLKRINVTASAMDAYKRLLPKYLHRKLVGF